MAAVLDGMVEPDRRVIPTRRLAAPLLALAGLLLLGSTAAVGYGVFSEVHRIGNVSAAASRPVSLAEARTTGLPVPSSSELPGGWVLAGTQPVGLTRTPSFTVVGLQYDRDGKRGMNVNISNGLKVFDTERQVFSEILTVSGTPVYVVRERHGEFDGIRAYFDHHGATVEMWAFGPALVDRPLTPAALSELVATWMQRAN